MHRVINIFLIKKLIDTDIKTAQIHKMCFPMYFTTKNFKGS